MKIQLVLITLILVVVPSAVLCEENNIFVKGVKAKNVHHSGDVWLSHVSEADNFYEYNVAVAEFAPGARLDWHLHPAGQQLIVVDGIGYYQERNSKIQIVKKGDVIKCKPDVEHWHAATPKTGVTYIAITGNKPTKWLEPVGNEVYFSVQSNE